MEDYTIQTPEQVEIAYSIAGLGSRMFAMVIDALLQGALLFAAALSLGSIPAIDAFVADWYLAAAILVIALVTHGYFLFFELVMKGRTPGKVALGLRVLRKDGRAVDLSGILLRNLIRPIDALPGFYAVGLISMFATADSRRLGDLVAGTIVVADRKRATLGTVLAEQTDRVSSDLDNREYTMLRDFMARRDSLNEEARRRLAQQLAESLQGQYEVTEQDRHDPEGFLERVYRGQVPRRRGY